MSQIQIQPEAAFNAAQDVFIRLQEAIDLQEKMRNAYFGTAPGPPAPGGRMSTSIQTN